MSDYTRVTIAGTRRKADLVLPDDEPITALLPDVLDLLDETPQGSARPVALATTVGEQLDTSLTLAEQQVRHGTILRLVRVDAAPPPPDVADVTDVVGDATSGRVDAWTRGWGTATATVVASLLGALAARDAGVVMALIALALAGTAVLTARRGYAAPAAVLTGGAVGTALGPALATAQDNPFTGVLGTFLVWFTLAGTIVGAVWVFGYGRRAVGLGTMIGPALLLVGHVAIQLGVAPAPAAAITVILAAAVLGVLPGIAMSLSGLSGIDDRVVEGLRVSRADTTVTVHEAHRCLTAATVTTSLVVGALGWLLVDSGDLWDSLIVVAVGLLLLLRTRVLPLAPQRLALIVGGSAPLLALLVQWSAPAGPGQVIALFGGVLLLSVLVGGRPPAHLVARLRRAAGVAEMLVALPLIPFMLASLGVFADLAGAF